MKVGKLSCVNGVAVETEMREVKQSELTSECWTIQFSGLDACKSCEFLNKKDCGGKAIRKKLMNAKGISVPLGQTV